jgi:hypothetical protein
VYLSNVTGIISKTNSIFFILPRPVGAWPPEVGSVAEKSWHRPHELNFIDCQLYKCDSFQNQEKWFVGPELKTARSGHSCALRTVGAKAFEIMVAGGNDGSNVLNSVEVLTSAASEWTPG